MKTKQTAHARKQSLNSRLLAYSTTVGAAILVAPVAHATIENITSFDIVGGGTGGSVPGATGPMGVQFKPIASGNSLNALSINVGPAHFNIFENANATNDFARNGLLLKRLNKSSPVTANAFGTKARISAGDTNWARSAGHKATGYIGFESHRNAVEYYGWLHVRITSSANAGGFIGGSGPGLVGIHLIAANGDPGVYGAIGLAGDNPLAGVGVGVVAVPETVNPALSGLTLLAMGAAGVREYRRRKNAAEATN